MNENLLKKTFVLVFPSSIGALRREEVVIVTAVAEDGTIRVDYNNYGRMAMCPGPKAAEWRHEWQSITVQIRRCVLLGEKFDVPARWFRGLHIGEARCTID